MNINEHKITVNRFSVEIPEELDRDLRTFIQTETEIYDVSTPDKQDGTFDKVYKAKVVGSTIVKQGDKKPMLAKSKRSLSKKLRSVCWHDNPDEDFYELFINGIISNYDEVKELLKIN